MLTRKWKEEWKRLLPNSDLDWKTVVNGYYYHFGSPDQLSESCKDGGDRDGGLDDAADGGKVKGFRNWTAKTKLDLLETHRTISRDYPDLEPGSSEYNKLLLQEFQKLHPKCMESSRSIYSKVQSVEKELQNGGGPPRSSAAAAGTRGNRRHRPSSDPVQPPVAENGSNGDLEGEEGAGEAVEGGANDQVEEESPEAGTSNGEASTSSAAAPSQPHNLAGFEEWNLTMIRDFIACMDSTRRKFATLKEKNPTGNVKLVPLLLDEWKKLYPDTQETVKTFLVKIKHLKQQKDLIKRSLCKAGLLPKMEAAGTGEPKKRKAANRANSSTSGDDPSEFKWHKSMIDDVIISRRKALEMKEQGLKRGKKLSFHQLWASEFKKVYPNSTFTSNNLSVHLWTWRKQQQRLGKGDPMSEEIQATTGGNSGRSNNYASSSSSSTPNWTTKLKLQLVDLGRKVQASLIDPETPNEQKVLGFSNMLHEEWLKLYPKRSDTARALNMMYCRIIKDGADLLDYASSGKGEKGKSTWTPKYNRGLRECIDIQNSLDPVSYSVYSQKVIQRWRKRFPKAKESDFSLKLRISDLISSRDDLAADSVANNSSSFLPDLFEGPSKASRSTANASEVTPTATKDSTSNDTGEEDAGDSLKGSTSIDQGLAANLARAPNSRGQMCWNKQTIKDLFHCHQAGLAKRQKSLTSMSKKEAPILSTLVHEEFLKLHPYCKLTPAILMAKLYCWKNALNKGTLDLEMSAQDEIAAAKSVKQELESEQPKADVSQSLSIKEVANSNAASLSKDIVYRTWSQEMMDNLVKTRKSALARKQKLLEQGKLDVQLLDIWYEEFLKLHPDYKSTKKNLMQKFKWYRARMKKIGTETAQAGGTPAAQPAGGNASQGLEILAQTARPDANPVRIRNVRKDVFLHIKALMEESRIFLPMKLPQEPELRQQDILASMSPLPMMPPSSSPSLAHHAQQQFRSNMVNSVLPSSTAAPSIPLVFSSQSSSPMMPSYPSSSSGQPLRPPGMDRITASQALSQLHQQAMQQQDIPVSLMPTHPEPPPLTISVSHQPKTEMPLNLSLPTHIKQQQQMAATAEEELMASESDKKDAIKLPGGATLVAVTDRNADAILKPKPVEKPHVTITIGEKMKLPTPQLPSDDFGDGDNNRLSFHPRDQKHLDIHGKQPPVVLSIPRFPLRNPDIGQLSNQLQIQQPPPVPQLKPFGIDPNRQAQQVSIMPIQQQQQQLQQQQPGGGLTSPYNFTPRAIFIPSRVKARLDEHGMTDLQFIQLLGVYDKARNEYIDTLKRGYLAFFAYILGSYWKQQVPNSPMTGRKLALIVDLYVEEKNKGKIVTPEYLTKKPCQFVVTEQVLRQVLLTRAEIVRDMEEKRDSESAQPVNSAIANVELCKKWAAQFPELKMTAKQLISIHEMLTYDTSKSSASPEIECTLSDVWKLMEKSVSRSDSYAEKFKKQVSDSNEEDDKYCEETFSVDQLQEWLIETQACPSGKIKIQKRPRYSTQNLRFHWTLDKIEHLEDCRLLACAKWRIQGNKAGQRKSLATIIWTEWKRRYPKDSANRGQVMAKITRMIRQSKTLKRRRAEKTFNKWRKVCEEFSKSEELNQVICEEQRLEEMKEDVAEKQSEAEDADSAFSGRLTSLSKIASLQIASNTKRNFHDDEDVLSYIGEVQRLGKGNHPITWTPDVIKDLIKARQLARSRKREWEAWATREYGGIGFAYNNPDVKNVKVDDMFKEEWCKLRPSMSSLSIWTLVSYARKYDNLKKQLIIDNGQTNMKKEVPVKEVQEVEEAVPEKKMFHINVFFENSSIPKFDLEELDKLPNVPWEFRDLLKARQRAKERQDEQKVPLSLPELFLEEWLLLHPETRGKVNGLEQQRKLWAMERVPGNVALVSPALLRATATEKAWPTPQDDEVPTLAPRSHVYVDDPEDLRFGVSVRTELTADNAASNNKRSNKRVKREKWYMRFSQDIYSVNKLGLSVPALEKEDADERDWDDENAEEEDCAATSRFPPKALAFADIKSDNPHKFTKPKLSVIHHGTFAY